jgi:hypothetical protein
MATYKDLAERLLTRFRDVPKVTLVDAEDWMVAAMEEHGLRLDRDVPPNMERLLLLYAEADGAQNISLRTAFYFEYRDGEESVDKRNVSEQYRKIATELWKKYREKKIEVGFGIAGTRFGVAPRIDRR